MIDEILVLFTEGAAEEGPEWLEGFIHPDKMTIGIFPSNVIEYVVHTCNIYQATNTIINRLILIYDFFLCNNYSVIWFPL